MKVVRIFPRCFDQRMNEELEVEVTKEELKAILYTFKKAKSPRPNGWTVEFYLGFYDLLEVELLRVIEESRLYRKVLGALNSTFIALIPKKSDPNSFEDFQPISLCNLIYKFIVKVIANRLKGMLSSFISQEQFGFLFNRQIHDVVGTTQEGLHTIKQGKISSCSYED
jgi:hypothetical protein